MTFLFALESRGFSRFSLWLFRFSTGFSRYAWIFLISTPRNNFYSQQVLLYHSSTRNNFVL